MRPMLCKNCPADELNKCDRQFAHTISNGICWKENTVIIKNENFHKFLADEEIERLLSAEITTNEIKNGFLQSFECDAEISGK